MYVCNYINALPLNAGQIRHTPRPPIPRNCPREASRKKAGIPAKTKQTRYGTKKAPIKTGKHVHSIILKKIN